MISSHTNKQDEQATIVLLMSLFFYEKEFEYEKYTLENKTGCME